MHNLLRNIVFSMLGAAGAAAVLSCVPAPGDDSAGNASELPGPGDQGAGDGEPTSELSSALITPFNITGIIGTGQSLSVGAEASALSAAARQPHFNNLKLSLGGAAVPPFNPNAAQLSLVPLVEPIRPFATTFPS